MQVPTELKNNYTAKKMVDHGFAYRTAHFERWPFIYYPTSHQLLNPVLHLLYASNSVYTYT